MGVGCFKLSVSVQLIDVTSFHLAYVLLDVVRILILSLKFSCSF